MIPESVLLEMEQRPGEKTHSFLSRQQMARNTIRKMNALEVHLSHLMADEEYKGKMGDTIRNENRTNTTRETKGSVSTLA